MKNKQEIHEIIDRVQSKIGHDVSADIPALEIAYQDERNGQPLTIKILSILGGVLASLAFVLFLYLSRLDRSQSAMYIFSAAFFLVSIVINKRYDKVILDTISVCLYILAYVLFSIALNMHTIITPYLTTTFFLIFALITLLICRSYILTFLSVLIFFGSCIHILFDTKNDSLLHLLIIALASLNCYMMLNEAKIMSLKRTLANRYLAIRTGLAVSLLMSLYFVSRQTLIDTNFQYNWLCSAGLIFLIIWIINTILNQFDRKQTDKKILIFVVVLISLGFTAMSPAITGALLLLLLSFKVNYKTGIALGIISFIYAIGIFYYDLNMTLLHKSMTMFLAGLFFLLLYLLIFRKSTHHEKA